jgi:predicted ATPase/class 3 adenylate cyclase
MTLPTGTVTLLFTDLEDSTKHLQALGERYDAVLLDHRKLIEKAVAEHEGVAFGSEGDAVFAVFDRATDATHGAVQAQLALMEHPWPPQHAFRVRMGLHTGDVRVVENDYVGLAVHVARRVCDAGHGGQILCTAVTRGLAGRSLDVSFRDVGSHELKSLDERLQLFQLVHPGLETEFPPVRSVGTTHNLPLEPTSFVGRERELEEAGRLLAGSRLLTLTGPGGTGKTRLAVRLASDMAGGFNAGAWFVDLSAVTTDIEAAVARALGAREDTRLGLWESIADRLRGETALAVLDNCEHVLPACRTLVRSLLQTAPALTMLATSREPLGLPGEVAWPVPPLDAPPPDGTWPGDVERYAALRLFVERATAADPAFVVGRDELPAVVRICNALDGMPLAIELAAGKVRALSVDEIARRLDDRFALLTAAHGTRAPRHITLRATVDWSYDLLGDEDRRLLRNLGVFTGGFSFDAAEGALGADIDAVVRLVDRSLVQRDPEDRSRYRLLETIRRYAEDRLREAGGLDAARESHAAWYASLAERGGVGVNGPDQVRWLGLLDREHDNLGSALSWSIEADPGRALAMAAALFPFWHARGYWAEGLSWLERAVGAAADPAPLVLAKALTAAGQLAVARGDLDPAGAYLGDALRLARASGDDGVIADALHATAVRVMRTNRFTDSIPLEEEAIALYRRVGNQRGAGLALNGIALATQAGFHDLARASDLYEESIRILRAAGDERAVLRPLGNLANMQIDRGDFGRARDLTEQCERSVRRLGDFEALVQVLLDLARLAMEVGDLATARACVDEASDLVEERGARGTLGFRTALVRSWVVIDEGRFDDALAAADRLAALGGVRPETEALIVRAFVLYLRGELDEARTAALRAIDLARETGSLLEDLDARLVLTFIEAARGAAGDATAAGRVTLRAQYDALRFGEIPLTLDALCAAARAGGDLERAARLLGASDALYERRGQVRRPSIVALADGVRAEIHARGFAVALREGAGWSLDDTVAYALS